MFTSWNFKYTRTSQHINIMYTHNWCVIVYLSHAYSSIKPSIKQTLWNNKNDNDLFVQDSVSTAPSWFLFNLRNQVDESDTKTNWFSWFIWISRSSTKVYLYFSQNCSWWKRHIFHIVVLVQRPFYLQFLSRPLGPYRAEGGPPLEVCVGFYTTESDLVSVV